MKKLIVPLILDCDVNLANKFNQAIEPIFAKVYLQTNVTQFENDCRGLKPAVIFVNLNIQQREDSFALIEKLNREETRPVIYGYLDDSGPELIAHAIENGVQDVFIRPFDTDVIASKINQHVKSDATQERELSFTSLAPSYTATVNLNFKIVAVDENGISLQGKHFITKGTKFLFSNNLVKEIFGKESIMMMVTKSSQNDDGKEYVFFIEPKEPSEAHSSALRRFIASKRT